LKYWLLVTGPKGHWSEESLVRKVTGPNRNPNPTLTWCLTLGIRKHWKAFHIYVQ